MYTIISLYMEIRGRTYIFQWPCCIIRTLANTAVASIRLYTRLLACYNSASVVDGEGLPTRASVLQPQLRHQSSTTASNVYIVYLVVICLRTICRVSIRCTCIYTLSHEYSSILPLMCQSTTDNVRMPFRWFLLGANEKQKWNERPLMALWCSCLCIFFRYRLVPARYTYVQLIWRLVYVYACLSSYTHLT